MIVRETGSIQPKADVELGEAIAMLRLAGGVALEPTGLVLASPPGRTSLARRLPIGVVGVISPFNFPLILSLRAAAPALAVGNAVVIKPDVQTPFAGGFVIALALEAAGLPAGLLHVLPGGREAGEALVTDPRVGMIAFTGSTATGRRVGELAGRHLKKVSLELGGKNSLIVLDDADLELAAGNVAWGAWLHQGQICMSAGRILVHERIAGELVRRVAQKADKLPVGNPATEEVALGPLINAAQVEHCHGIVQDSVAAGAVLEAGGSYEGLFYRPTVLSAVTRGVRAFDEEIFGPVACVSTFASADEAVALANDTDYGLSAAIISPSLGRARSLGERLHTGLLHINDQTVNDETMNPFGGRGCSGNGASAGAPTWWDQFTAWQWMTIRDEPPRYPF
jgi:benzaldehyde dehydrogenase (NAD)